ncbi:ferredoxin-NADPH reductase [Nonomuraea diastatica]|uniref:Ferredoxin-NADPH reductase n=1 Tax=Nonomuraea diastatica TaxID=1848329 RepID=A0A4R4WKA1_9ACTN|nr:ferredoxin-NADPH reductase [Nonomuraea diastatica]TDD14110.1 ferredoxin-NADPH reductase [Nonomuraea diastatica]
MSARARGTGAAGHVSGVRRLLRPAAQTTYEKVFGTVYVGLMTNVLLALACSPFLAALAIVRDPLASWPFFSALSALCAPALTGAFACFAALGETGPIVVLRPFLDGYRRGGLRAVLVWAAGAAAVGMLALDAVVVSRTGWGPALVPFFATAAVLVACVALAVLVLLAEARREPVRVRDLVRPGIYLVARRWYLAALNVAVLGLAVAVVLAKPVIGVLLLGAPLLYLVWATTRFVVAPVLPAPGQASAR